MGISDISDIFFGKYYNLTLRYLSFRQRSEKEVFDYLRKKQVQEPLVEIIINKLKEQKFINDEEFARMWIENRMRFKPRAGRFIKMELKQKGITEEIINKQLAINKDGEMAKILINKKIKKYKDLPRQEIYQKLGRVLAQKGFDWETIKKNIDEVLGKGV
ncbi:MAG: RecX family transcriptional regulator [bacterium]|nr:RecX family transcriptional regulator [bacterium]